MTDLVAEKAMKEAVVAKQHQQKGRLQLSSLPDQATLLTKPNVKMGNFAAVDAYQIETV